MRPAGLVAALLLTGLLCAVPASATPILTGGTEIEFGVGIAGNAVFGFNFNSTIDQSVTALGFWDAGSNGLPQSVPVGLWDTATQALLGSATIDNLDPLDSSITVLGGQWRYETLLSPIALLSGHTYTLGFFLSDTLLALDSLLLSYPTITAAPTVTVANVRRAISSSSLVFPTSSFTANDGFTANANAQLGPAVNSVPEPTSMLLLGTGLIGPGVRRYRRRQ